MAEKMEIRGIGHPTDTMMTVENPEGERFLVFDKEIFPHLELGKIVELEVKRDIAKKSGDGTYNLIQSITVDGKVIGGKKRSGFTSRGRDEDRTDRRSNLITIKDIWIAGKIKDTNPLVIWLLAELLVGATGKKEAKGETNKTNTEATDRQQGKERTPGQDSGGALEVLPEKMTAGELFSWIISKDKTIKAPRVWLEVEYKVSHEEVLTIEKCHELYRQIRKDKGW